MTPRGLTNLAHFQTKTKLARTTGPARSKDLAPFARNTPFTRNDFGVRRGRMHLSAGELIRELARKAYAESARTLVIGSDFLRSLTCFGPIHVALIN